MNEFVARKEEKTDYLTLLQTAIEERHQCAAVHRETVHLLETLEGQVIWEGNVEVFDLTGNPDAIKCYAWSHHEKGTRGHVLNSKNMRLITVLGKRPVTSPQMAVRAAIFYDVQPVSTHEIFRDNHPNLPSAA